MLILLLRVEAWLVLTSFRKLVKNTTSNILQTSLNVIQEVIIGRWFNKKEGDLYHKTLIQTYRIYDHGCGQTLSCHKFVLVIGQLSRHTREIPD